MERCIKCNIDRDTHDYPVWPGHDFTTGSDYEWPLTLDEVHKIVEHLMYDGTRNGLIYADTLNKAMGASARRMKGVS